MDADVVLLEYLWQEKAINLGIAVLQNSRDKRESNININVLIIGVSTVITCQNERQRGAHNSDVKTMMGVGFEPTNRGLVA